MTDSHTVAAPRLDDDLQGLVELRQVEVVYNKRATAVEGVSMSVREGSITALVGVNGAGKTTTLKAISGFMRGENADVVEGSITFRGEDITGLRPHKVSERGIALVPERDKVFETLDVEENLRVAAGGRGGIAEALERFPVLGELRRRQAGFLSGGEKQLLAIAMALLNDPQLLLVDELSLGLAPRVIEQIMGELVEVHEALGVTILLVEQNVGAALEVADYGYVMEDGHIVFDGPADELRNHQDIMEFYLGVAQDEDERRSYRDVRQYRRKRRWWG